MTATADHLDSLGNRHRGFAFRNEVALEFLGAGIQARVPTLSEPHLGADIKGVPGWTIATSSTSGLEGFTAAVNRAEERAGHDGSEFYAAVKRRAAHPTSGAYVVMPLSVFLRVLGLLALRGRLHRGR